MAEAAEVRVKRDGAITIKDSGASNTYTVSVEPGDFNYAAPGYTVIRPLDRGEFVTPRRGDAQPVTLGFSVHLRDIGSATDATLPDICEDRGYVAANWTSTLDATSDVVAYDVDLVIDGTFTGEADKTVAFSDVSLRGSFAEGDPDTYTVTGEASILKPTVS